MRARVLLGLSIATMLAGGVAAQPHELAEAKPETVGFSAQRLERLHAVMQKFVDDGQMPGIVTVLARHGKIIDSRSYGKRDIASGAPMEKDTIVRIYSMTKPLTGVAMMMLYEQGKWNPADPIAKYIPEFANLKVYKSMGADGKPVVENPAHAPTMAELMSHTAGFTYGIFGETAVDKMYRDTAVFGAKNLQGMIDRLAKIPLLYQPGTQWVYSISADIQGYIIEKLSGQSLGEFMRENILLPLGMKDTAFHIAPDKIGRFATLYSMNDKGKLEASNGGNVAMEYAKEPTMPLGGGGLLSTAADYTRFMQMMLNGGEFGGTRMLAPSSVSMMRTNRLPAAITNREEFGIGTFRASPGQGFGLDFAVFTDPAFISHPVGKGTYSWGGAAGTWFWIDPANDIVFVGLVQRVVLPGSPDMGAIAQQMVYQALVNPEK